MSHQIQTPLTQPLHELDSLYYTVQLVTYEVALQLASSTFSDPYQTLQLPMLR
jgi:hypothetical protein